MSDLRSRVLGTIFGTLSRGTFPQRNPVAWLYNGVRLPGLPVVEGLSSAGIYKIYSNGLPVYFLVLSANEMETESGLKGVFNAPIARYRYDQDSDSWTLVAELTEGSWSTMLTGFVWATYDIYYHDSGNLFLAKSEPVPVYE